MSTAILLPGTQKEGDAFSTFLGHEKRKIGTVGSGYICEAWTCARASRRGAKGILTRHRRDSTLAVVFVEASDGRRRPGIYGTEGGRRALSLFVGGGRDCSRLHGRPEGIFTWERRSTAEVFVLSSFPARTE